MEERARSKLSVPPGTRLGRYEVITEIASGGMATVFLGRALGAAGFQRLVAIKCLHPHVARDEEFVAMFMDEARLAARIRHPNCVATLDLENGDDGLFLVMEFVEGDGLLGLLRATVRENRRIPAPIAVRIVLDALHGLHAAHELTGDSGELLHLVHRDVSPHNLLVGIDGISRITDFGIARAEERLGVTRDGQVKGKLAYMAPEQTDGGPVDRRADLFSTGVVLWETLAGRRLFWGANDGEVLRNLLQNPIPRLREAAPELPAELEAVCIKALQRDPTARFDTAAMFAEALEEAGGAVGIASSRAVGSFVKECSGTRIDEMTRQVRLYTGELPASAVRPVTRTRLPTDPERTNVQTGTHGVPSVVSPSSPPAAPAGSSGSLPAVSNPTITLAVAPVDPRAANVRFVAGVAAGMAAALLVGGGAYMLGRSRQENPERIGAPIVVGASSPQETRGNPPPVTDASVAAAANPSGTGNGSEVVAPRVDPVNTAQNGEPRGRPSSVRRPSVVRPVRPAGNNPPPAGTGNPPAGNGTYNPEAM